MFIAFLVLILTSILIFYFHVDLKYQAGLLNKIQTPYATIPEEEIEIIYNNSEVNIRKDSYFFS